MSKIAPCLRFDGQAAAAANFYVSTFQDCGQEAVIGDMLRHGASGPGTGRDRFERRLHAR